MLQRDSDPDPARRLEQHDRGQEKPDVDVELSLVRTRKTRNPKRKELGAAGGNHRGRKSVAGRGEV